MRRLFASTIAVLLVGCASSAVTYRVADDQHSGSRIAAEQRHAELVQGLPIAAELDAPLRVLKSRFPDFPRGVLNTDSASTVRIEFLIEADGSVSNPQVIGPAHSEVASVCLEAIQSWKFAPPLKNGVPVRVQAAQRFTFKLE